MKPFLIVAPPFTPQSNGIRIVHKIHDTLRGVGCRSELALIDSNDPKCQRIICPRNSEAIKNGYVLYPETIVGNPLGATRVIRFLGNKESYCSGMSMSAGAHDFKLAHSRSIMPNADYILFNADFHPAFNSDGTKPYYERTADATYVGKGYLYGPTKWFNGTTRIERLVPSTKEQLAAILKRTRFFITWDAWSATNVDAILCGAMVVIARYKPWTPEEIDGSELGTLPRMEMMGDRFPIADSRDYPEYQRLRSAMKAKIDGYVAGWESGVREFTQKVEAHFCGC